MTNDIYKLTNAIESTLRTLNCVFVCIAMQTKKKEKKKKSSIIIPTIARARANRTALQKQPKTDKWTN